jgi:hypothetical protein
MMDWRIVLLLVCFLGMFYGAMERSWNLFNVCLFVAFCCAGALVLTLL